MTLTPIKDAEHDSSGARSLDLDEPTRPGPIPYRDYLEEVIRDAPPRYLPTILMTLALLTVALDAAAQSFEPPASVASESEGSDYDGLEAEDLATQLAAVDGDARELDGMIHELRVGARADATIIASLNVTLEDRAVTLRSRPSVPGVVGRTLAAACLAGFVVAGARYMVAETIDVWLIAVSGAQCGASVVGC